MFGPFQSEAAKDRGHISLAFILSLFHSRLFSSHFVLLTLSFSILFLSHTHTHTHTHTRTHFIPLFSILSFTHSDTRLCANCPSEKRTEKEFRLSLSQTHTHAHLSFAHVYLNISLLSYLQLYFTHYHLSLSLSLSNTHTLPPYLFYFCHTIFLF